MYISNFLAGGSVLQGKAGNYAINAGDLLLINPFGNLYTAQVSDYAATANSGTAAVAATTVTSYAFNPQSRKFAFINPADSSLFVAAAYLASNYGISISKYSSGGALLSSTILDSTAAVGEGVSIAQLTNGNLVVVWGDNDSAPFSFAIVDLYLDIIVAKTTIVASGVGNGNDVQALSGGGFATAYNVSGTGVGLAIYTNTGSVTYSATNITSTPTAGLGCKIAQLSNGNIVVGVTSTTASKAVGHAIFSATGTSVLAFTILDSNTAVPSGGNQQSIDLLALSTGGYCIAGYDNTPQVAAYVCNNAGTVQGSAFTNGETIDASQAVSLTTDGTNFWLAFAGSGVTYAFLPSTGTGYVVTNPSSTIYSSLMNVIFDRGFIISSDQTSNAISVYQITPTNGLGRVNTITPSIGLTGQVNGMKVAGDFSVFMFQASTSTQFAVQKYLNTAIVGVASIAVSAGNAGTLLPYAMGPGGYQCNAVIGSVGKSFTNAATNIVGNVGTIMGNSVALAGIA